MTINSSGALDSHDSFDGTASVALNPARDLPFMVASNGAVTIYSADGRTALPAEWTGICVDARDVGRFWHIGRSESERSFTALLATTYHGAASEAESRGLTLAPQWFVDIQPPLWNKIVDTAGLDWNASMLKHWDEFSDVEQDALNSAADKVMTYRYELRVAGEQFMTGDQSSIGMLFGNLTGRNFSRKKDAGEGHQDWLRYMSMEYSTSLPMGAVVEMLSPAGDLIRQNSIGGLLGVNLVLQAENSEVKVVGDTQKSETAQTRVVEFVSVWDDGEIVTKAILDLQTGEVRDIEVSDNGVEFESLQYEEIRVDGMWATVTASDDNRYFVEDMAMLPQFGFGYGRAERRIVELPDGYNGSVKKFFAEPLERNGATVKLQCAEPGQEYLIAWKAESEVAAALTQQEVTNPIETEQPGPRKPLTYGDGQALIVVAAQRMGLEPGLLDDAIRQLEGKNLHAMVSAAISREACHMNDLLRHDPKLIDQANDHVKALMVEYGFAAPAVTQSTQQSDAVPHPSGSWKIASQPLQNQKPCRDSSPGIHERKLPLNIQRLIDDEVMYARQGTFSPSYLEGRRDGTLEAFFETDSVVAAAHASLLRAVWKKNQGVLRVHRDTPALIAAALGMKSTELLPVVEVVNDDEKPLCRTRLANGDVWTIEPGPGWVLTVTSPSGKRSLVSLKDGVAELVVSGNSNEVAAAAASLEQKFGEEHPEFDRESHAREVVAGGSRLGEYWEWVVHQIEADGRSVDDEISGLANRCW